MDPAQPPSVVLQQVTCSDMPPTLVNCPHRGLMAAGVLYMCTPHTHTYLIRTHASIHAVDVKAIRALNVHKQYFSRSS